MKLRNKKTGKVIEWFSNTGGVLPNSLAELNEEWEDCEEPKDFQYIMADGGIDLQPDNNSIFSNGLKEIGNYFETKEEAEKAVEKLKAWKRLKNFGFKFIGKDYRGDKNFGSAFFQVGEGKNIRDFYQDNQDFYDDLDLLFCPEENS